MDMKKWGLLAFSAVLALVAVDALAQVRVRGYTRKDGTYVAPHYRSAPNSTKYDNYSTQGNYNPYTGKKGTVDPDGTYTYPSTTYVPLQPYSSPPVYVDDYARPGSASNATQIAPASASSWRQQDRPQSRAIQPSSDRLSTLLALREEVDKEIEKEIASLREISTRGRYVWKCTGGYGEATYISYPRSGCEQITVYSGE